MTLRYISVLAALALLTAASLPGQAISSEFTGGIDSRTTFTNFGTITCPSGAPAGPFPPLPPCSPGSRVHVRDVVFWHHDTATDARVTGKYIFSFNANTDGWVRGNPGAGQMWGTIRVEVDEGGVWEGTYTGDRTVVDGGVLAILKVVAHGSGGRIDGLKAEWHVTAPHSSPSTFTGRILEPPGKEGYSGTDGQ